MTTYLHPDLDILRAKLAEEGFEEVELMYDDYTLVYSKKLTSDWVAIDLPESEVYEAIEVHFDQSPSTALLERLGFPL